jgi:hypothetical protein
MKSLINIGLVFLLVIASYSLMAQKVKVKAKGETAVTTVMADPNTKIVHAYLGRSNYGQGAISKKLFDSLLRQGLTARDAAGNNYKVQSFTFNYAERNLYEDSVGNPIVLTDFITEFCAGDTLSTALKMNIFYKTKPGDTAWFDGIKVLLPEGRQIGTKGMKFTLVK